MTLFCCTQLITQSQQYSQLWHSLNRIHCNSIAHRRKCIVYINKSNKTCNKTTNCKFIRVSSGLFSDTHVSSSLDRTRKHTIKKKTHVLFQQNISLKLVTHSLTQPSEIILCLFGPIIEKGGKKSLKRTSFIEMNKDR